MTIKRTSYYMLFCGSLVALGLSACSKEVSLCEEAMSLRSDQLGFADRDRQKFLDSCRTGGKVFSAHRWECTIAAMKKGAAYDQAMEQCAPR